MNKTRTILSLAVCNALALPAAVQADSMTLYGSAAVAVEALDNGSTNTSEVSNNHSAFGIKGSRNLGNGLSAVYLFDMFVNLDNGGGNGTLLGGGRDGWVGLSGEAWGIVALGYQGRPWKTATNHLDLFGNTIADYSAIMGNTPTGYFDGGIGNSLIWFGPNFNGLSWHLQYGADEADDSSNDWGAQVNYSRGPLYAVLSHDVDGRSETAEDLTATKLAASYEVTSATTLTGMVEAISGADADTRNAYYLGASHRIANTTLKFAYAMAGDSDAGKDTGASYFALGVSQRLASNVELYALYSAVDNSASASYGFVSAPHTSSNGNTEVAAAGDDSSVFAVGVRYDFAWER